MSGNSFMAKACWQRSFRHDVNHKHVRQTTSDLCGRGEVALLPELRLKICLLAT